MGGAEGTYQGENHIYIIW